MSTSPTLTITQDANGSCACEFTGTPADVYVLAKKARKEIDDIVRQAMEFRVDHIRRTTDAIIDRRRNNRNHDGIV